MKVTRFFIFAAMVGSMLAGCSKDKGDAKLKNAYTYDGKTTTIVWAGYYHADGHGYYFGIAPKSPAGNLPNEADYFGVVFPESKLGVKCNLSQNNSGTWIFDGLFKSNGIDYSYGDNNFGVSGTDNWVKVTKNTGGEHNFTIEFEMTIGGKRLIGNYTGNFQKCNDSDIYWGLL